MNRGRFTIIPKEILLEDIAAKVALGAVHIQWKHPDPRMDTLQKQVVKEVGEMTKLHFSTEEIFYKLRECAISMAEGRSVVNLSLPPLA